MGMLPSQKQTKMLYGKYEDNNEPISD